MCFSLSFFLGGEKNKSNKKLKEKASTYNPSLMIPRMFKLTHPFLLIIITSKTSFSPDKVVVLRSRVSPPSHLWLIFRCGLRSCDEQFGFMCFALFFCFFFTQVQVSSHSLFLLLSLTFTSQCAAPRPSSGKGGVTFLPGRDVAVMHVGSHHHAGSASVALKRREIVRESTTDCIFQAMTASQEQFKTLDLFF